MGSMRRATTHVFDLLDVDESGFLTEIEFTEGLLNLCLLDTPIATWICLGRCFMFPLFHSPRGELTIFFVPDQQISNSIQGQPFKF